MLQFASNALCQKDLKYFNTLSQELILCIGSSLLPGMIVWYGNDCLGGNTSKYNKIKFSYHMQLFGNVIMRSQRDKYFH